MPFDFLIVESTKFCTTWLLAYLLGTLVNRGILRVNYARKIQHFKLMFISILLPYAFPNYSGGLAGLFSFLWVTAPFFLRAKSPFIARCFQSFDRPEDRPHTLLWLLTQCFATSVALVVVGLLMELYFGVPIAEVSMFILCASMLGDGVAEPIGITFGKHKYRAYALFSKKRYYRTLEGSLSVFACTALVVLWFASLFTGPQFIVAFFVVPIVVTVAEAISPHTWDSPFLILASGLTVGVILGVL